MLAPCKNLGSQGSGELPWQTTFLTWCCHNVLLDALRTSWVTLLGDSQIFKSKKNRSLRLVSSPPRPCAVPFADLAVRAFPRKS